MEQTILISISRNFTLLFIGFCMFQLTATIVKPMVGVDLKLRLNSAKKYAIELTKLLGVVLLFYSIIVWVYVYKLNENNFLTERAQGPYKWAYYTMSFRTVFLALLTQFFWSEKVRMTKWIRSILILIMFLASVLSGRNFELFVIIVTSLHRDYLPSSWGSVNEGRFLIAFGVLWYFLKSTIIFTGTLLVYWFFKNKKNDRIHTA